MNKTSIRFFGDKEIRAVWNEEDNKWWFSIVDIVAVFKITANRYKNRRNRFGLRMAIICGIINFENKS